MKPYPRYKPTGLAWRPSVPEHWEMVKTRSFFGRLHFATTGAVAGRAPRHGALSRGVRLGNAPRFFSAAAALYGVWLLCPSLAAEPLAG